MIAEIFGNADPARCGLRVGDIIAGQGIRGTDGSGRLGSGLLAQAELALENLRACVESAGGGLAQVAQVTLLMRDTKLLPEVNGAWVNVFPDAADRPTYKFINAPLPADEHIRMEFFAVANGRRQALYLPVVAHTNPIPMGVLIDGHLFSSRVLPMHPETGARGETTQEQTEFVFENASQLLSLAGLNWSNVVQGRVFAAADDGYQLISDGWRDRTGRVPVPVLHHTPYRAGLLAVMLEFIAQVHRTIGE